MPTPFSRSSRWLCCLTVALTVSIGFGQETTKPGAKVKTSGPVKTADIRSLRFDHVSDLVLSAPQERWQLLATGVDSNGQEFDLTRDVKWEVTPANIVEVDSNGTVKPLANGEATVKATFLKAGRPSSARAETKIRVAGLATARPVSFTHEIVPTFTALGCNGGGCHGKTEGQNGFKLSLFGFEPHEDHDMIVHEARGRRLNFAATESSLLLVKAISAVPHGGGKRLAKESFHYDLVNQWLIQGAPNSPTTEAALKQIEVVPAIRTIPRGGHQQLAVVATFADGSRRDVTALSRFDSNQSDLASVTANGFVNILNGTGIAAVMIRYQEQATVFRATVPLGAPVEELPTEKNLIDAHLIAQWKRLGLPPSKLCTDTAFIRRVTIDLAGRLPTVTETEQFVANASENKDEALVDQLLASQDHAEYFAAKWSAVLRNRRASDKDDRNPTEAFHAWIVDSLQTNKPFDQFVREILTAEGEAVKSPPTIWYREVNEITEQLEDTAQLFLGQRIQCARCHHHPFEKWSQHDYYSMAAFFSRLVVKEAVPEKKTKDKETKKETVTPGTPFMVSLKGGEAKAEHPKTKQKLAPAGLGAVPVQLDEKTDPRERLVDWMVDPQNPYFSRMLANRYWKHFFGRGLVEPEDDLRVTNPASNPELLDALAAKFVESKFDLKAFVRLICTSSAYRLSAETNAHNALDQQSFSRFYPRRLQAEVLLDAIDAVTISNSKLSGSAKRAVALSDNVSASYFLSVFGRPDAASACECERSSDVSLAQCLHLLNSKEILNKVSGGRASKLAKDKRPHAERISELYLTALSREPSAEELEALVSHIEAKQDDAAAYADLMWVLINTKEFLFNH